MLAQVGAHGVWKLTQPWTHRTRPPLLAKRADEFRTAPTTRHQVSLLRRRTKDKNSFRPQPQSPTDSAEEALPNLRRASMSLCLRGESVFVTSSSLRGLPFSRYVDTFSA